MRKNYISPEYSYTNVSGTFNMLEESTFFGSKMIEVEDTIDVLNQNILWYQNDKNEQLDYSIEFSKKSFSYSSIDNKKNSHTIELDKTQSEYQKETSTKWILSVDYKSILFNYIFANIKKYRTFEGIKNEMTKYNDIDSAISSYINFNIMDRYKIKSIELYLDYKDLNNDNTLKYSPSWVKSDTYDTLVINSNLNNKIQTIIDGENILVNFSQDKNGDKYTIEYYFNIFFEKI